MHSVLDWKHRLYQKDVQTKPLPGVVVESSLGSLLNGIVLLCAHAATLMVPMLSSA